MASITEKRPVSQQGVTCCQQKPTQRYVVAAYLQEEVALGGVVGPLPVGSIPGVQVSPVGVIPKGHTPGKWRLIVDLSSPSGCSINDDIFQTYARCPT